MTDHTAPACDRRVLPSSRDNEVSPDAWLPAGDYRFLAAHAG